VGLAPHAVNTIEQVNAMATNLLKCRVSMLISTVQVFVIASALGQKQPLLIVSAEWPLSGPYRTFEDL